MQNNNNNNDKEDIIITLYIRYSLQPIDCFNLIIYVLVVFIWFKSYKGTENDNYWWHMYIYIACIKTEKKHKFEESKEKYMA